MTKRRQFKLLIAFVIIALLFIVVRQVLTVVNQPATASVKFGKAPSAKEFSVNLTPRTELGKTVTFNYPAGLTPDAKIQPQPPVIEQFTYRAQDVESWDLAIDVSVLPAGNLSHSSSYTYRKAHPEIYQESQKLINGQNVVLVSDISVGGFSQVAYIVHGGLLGTVSLIGNDATGLQPLKDSLNMVLSTWRWL